jgi:hypothetical protein
MHDGADDSIGRSQDRLAVGRNPQVSEGRGGKGRQQRALRY